MSRVLMSAAVVVLAGIAVSGAPSAPRPGIDWPQFRGIAANGIAEGFLRTQGQIIAIGRK